MSLEQLFAEPEQDSWTYSSAAAGFASPTFVVALYRASGLFDPRLEFNVQEFTVRDLYELDFFNTTGQRQRPPQCQEADPHVAYCQIAGQYRIVIPDRTMSSVKPYNHMNERCPTRPAMYERLAGC